jgi:hypothetical protein
MPGVFFTENLPQLAQVNDKVTLIRSMSYTPNGLFNHTAAIYQMMTGYTTDKVSPSGQLEPPSPKDFPNFGSNLIRLKPTDEPMLPFVMLPRPLQESNVVGKGGTAGFLGKAYEPYTLYPARRRHGHGQDGPHQDRRSATAARGVRRPLAASSPVARDHQQRHARGGQGGRVVQAGRVLRSSPEPDRVGPSARSVRLEREPDELRDRYGRNTFGQSCLLARRLVEAGTRVVEVIWPKVANSDNHSWDHHTGLTQRMKNQSAPMLDTGLSALIEDLDQRGLLEETLLVAVANSGAARSAASAPRATATAPTAATTGRTATPP